MKAYKLTTQELTTHNGFKWEVGVEVTAKGETNKPCSDDVLHYYDSPLHAALFNCIHANIKNPVLWEIETSEQLGTDGLKSWCKTQTLLCQIPLPEITTEQHVEFAIRCARQIKGLPEEWHEWAGKWLSGDDRLQYAARAVARAAEAAARDAAWAAARAAEAAARAADTTIIQRAIDETFGEMK